MSSLTLIINKKKETLSGVRERERKRNGRRTRTKKEGERENTIDRKSVV